MNQNELENYLTSFNNRKRDRFNRNGKDMRLSKREGYELNRQARERIANYSPELKQRLKEYEERVKNS